MTWYRDWSIWSGIETGVGSYSQDKHAGESETMHPI